MDFIEAVKTPYLFKVGDVVVKLSFSKEKDAPSFEECMKRIVLNKLNK